MSNFICQNIPGAMAENTSDARAKDRQALRSFTTDQRDVTPKFTSRGPTMLNFWHASQLGTYSTNAVVSRDVVSYGILCTYSSVSVL